MLILTRKPYEKLCIGDDIVVMVQVVKGNQVRIGIDAPSEVKVHREEVYLAVKAQEEFIKKGLTHYAEEK